MSAYIDLLPLVLVLLFLWKAIPVRPLKSFNDSYLNIKPCRSSRGFMAIMVILHHLSQQTESGIILQMFRLFGNLPVSVFFFLSGYGLMKKQLSANKQYKALIKEKIPLLLFPLLIVLIIMYFIMQLTFSMQLSFGMIFELIVKGDPILVIYWYMLLIPLLYLAFAAAAFFFESKPGGIVLFMSLFTVIFIVPGNHLGLGQWWYNTCHLFTVGIIWAAYEKNILNFSQKHYYLCLFASGLGFIFVWQYFDLLFAIWPVQEMRLIISLVRNLCFALAFVFVTMKLRLGNSILDMLGSVSLELYLLHPVFLLLFRNSLIYISDDFIFCVAVLLSTIITALIFSRPYNYICKKYSTLIKT